MDHSRYTALFLADARDHLARAGALLLEWERAPGSIEPVAELFRAFHSIKGSAGTMGFQVVADLAHSAEHLLEAIRQDTLRPSKAVIGLLLRAVDVLEQGVEAVATGGAVPDAVPLSQALDRMAASASAAVPAERAAARMPGSVRRDPSRGVRIEPAKLDDLLHRAGELVVAANRLDAVAPLAGSREVETAAGQLGMLARGMHAGVLRARLAPAAELFARFPRVVRDLGEALGRLVRIEINGEDIELDRAMLEELADPLVHLARNAVDHGIETVSERIAAGKPPEGTVRLFAERRRDAVVVGLADDGRGIDRKVVSERAERLGLRRAGAGLPDDDELLGLLARPGFTLASSVTQVSGRGVGMDVVVSRVRALGGTVQLFTEPGRGTSIAAVLPLTTAVQRMLLVRAGGERYAIPFRLVREAARRRTAVAAPDGPPSRFSFRDRSLPLVDLASSFGTPPEPDRLRPVLVLEWGSRSGALAVEALLGQLDVVIERVEAPLGVPRWVSGAAMLPDGLPAFVLDPTALFEDPIAWLTQPS